jgi:hypothetical protein
MRRRAAIAVCLVALYLAWSIAPIALEDEARSNAVDQTPLGLRHAIVAAYTRLLPPVTDTADLTPMPHVSGNPYGINVFLEQEVEEAKVRRSLDMVRDAGFGWIKQQLVWGEVEVPIKGQFVDQATGGASWRKYDRIVDMARERGLGVVLRIDTSPAWARPGRDKLETPPDRIEDYGDFVAQVAEHYRGRVRYYQIWNEPNIPFEWGGEPPDAAAYTQLLRVASRRIHEVDSEAAVISAAMAPTTEFSEYGINELRYLQAMYDAGARGAFDILGANAYGLRSGPDDRRLAIDRDVNFSRPVLMRELMVRNGDAARPIWAAEVGWNAVPEGSDIPDLWGRVSRDMQARYSARAFARAQAEWPWMGVMNLWHFRLPGPNAKRLPQYYFNAVEEDFTPQPLYLSMQALATGPRAMQRGSREEDDWNVDYRGDWHAARHPAALLGRYRESAGPAGLGFWFDGTELSLVVDRLPGGGALAIEIDGHGWAANRLPLDEDGSARLDVASERERWAATVPVASGLADTRHRLEARTADGRPVRVDGFVVDRRPFWPGETPDGIALLLGLVAIPTIAVLARREAA